MGKLRPPAKSTLPVVKRARPKPKPPPKLHCVVCGAVLRSDHCSDLVCDCHPTSGCFPCQMPHDELDALVAGYVIRARGRPLNLYRALGCESTWENRAAIHRSVSRLNRAVFCGVSGHGYRVVTTGRGRRGKIGA